VRDFSIGGVDYRSRCAYPHLRIFRAILAGASRCFFQKPLSAFVFAPTAQAPNLVEASGIEPEVFIVISCSYVSLCPFRAVNYLLIRHI
jgi:hypothetical protein